MKYLPLYIAMIFIACGLILLYLTPAKSGATKPHPKPDYYVETIQGHQYIVFHNPNGVVKAVVPNKACPNCQ